MGCATSLKNHGSTSNLPSEVNLREETFLSELPFGSEKNLILLMNAPQVTPEQLESCTMKKYRPN